MLKLYAFDWKDNLNIDCKSICWFLLKILGISMIFRGVVSGRGWGCWGSPDPKKKDFTDY